MLIDWLEHAQQGWKDQGVRLGAGLEPAHVTARLLAAGRGTSTDVLAMFAFCNGMEGGASDERVFALWPLDRCIAGCTTYDEPDLPFADFLISSAEYSFRRESEDRSSVWIRYGGTGEPRRVASSVAEFFHFFVTEPGRLEIVL